MAGDQETTVKYPECEKLNRLSGPLQTLEDFMEWLQQEKGITLVTEHPELTGDFEYLPINVSQADIAQEYHGIDKKKLEKERQAMLTSLASYQGA